MGPVRSLAPSLSLSLFLGFSGAAVIYRHIGLQSLLGAPLPLINFVVCWNFRHVLCMEESESVPSAPGPDGVIKPG